MASRASIFSAFPRGFSAVGRRPFTYLGVVLMGATGAIAPLEALETLEPKAGMALFWLLLLAGVAAVTWTSLAALTISIDEDDPLDLVDTLMTGIAHTVSVIVGLVVTSVPFIIAAVLWVAAVRAMPEPSSAGYFFIGLTFISIIFLWVVTLYVVPAAVLEEECGGFAAAGHALQMLRERWLGLVGLVLLLAFLNAWISEMTENAGPLISNALAVCTSSMGAICLTMAYRIHRNPEGAPAAARQATAASTPPPPLPPHLLR